MAAPAPSGTPAPYASGPGLPTITAAAGQAGAQHEPTPSAGAVPGGPAAGSGTPGNASAGLQAGSHDPKTINPYIYTPSFSMAIIGASAFLISFVVHTIQLFKTKAWYFNIMTQAILMTAVGMIARCNSVVTLKSTGATGPFIIATMMEMIAPTLVSLANVFTYTRLVWWVTPNEKRNFKTLWGPPKATSIMWGGLFTVAEITKAVAQNALKPTDPLSTKIQETAQIAQFFMFLAFFLVSLRFMRISGRWLIHGAVEEKNWRKLGWTIVVSAGVLTARHAFTIVAMDARADPKGFWSLHEWVYWLSQPIPFFVIFTLYNNAYPGHFLPREYTGFRIKLKEIEKGKYENPWPIISPPIQNDDFFLRQDDKGMEVRLTELESGKRY